MTAVILNSLYLAGSPLSPVAAARAAVFHLLSLYRPIPKKTPSPGKVERSKQLFFNSRLSSNGILSCSACHDINGSVTDNRSVGVAVVELARYGTQKTPS